MHDVEEAAGEVGLVSVGEMAAMVEVHRQEAVSGLEDGEVDGHVGLRARVGLNVCVFGAEEFFGAVDGELFNDVHVFASAIPPAARVTFGVLVGEARALGLHDRAGGEVFGGD